MQQFAQKVLAGETSDIASMISPKATGWLKKLHEGEDSDAAVVKELEKLKTALTNAQISSDRQLKNQFLVVMEEGGSMTGPQNGNLYGDGGAGAKKRKAGKRVQFTLVSQGDSFQIVEIKVR